MITSLPWQHQIIVAELWITALITTWVIQRGHLQYSWRTLGWALSDITMLALLVWGAAEFHWQYLVLWCLYCFTAQGQIRKSLEGLKWEHEPNSSTYGVGLFCIIIAAGQTLLLIAANS